MKTHRKERCTGAHVRLVEGKEESVHKGGLHTPNPQEMLTKQDPDGSLEHGAGLPAEHLQQ